MEETLCSFIDRSYTEKVQKLDVIRKRLEDISRIFEENFEVQNNILTNIRTYIENPSMSGYGFLRPSSNIFTLTSYVEYSIIRGKLDITTYDLPFTPLVMRSLLGCVDNNCIRGPVISKGLLKGAYLTFSAKSGIIRTNLRITVDLFHRG